MLSERSYSPTGVPATDSRRRALLNWLRYTADGRLVTRAIAQRSGLYEGGHGRWDRCHSDLLALERQGLVDRNRAHDGSDWGVTE